MGGRVGEWEGGSEGGREEEILIEKNISGNQTSYTPSVSMICPSSTHQARVRLLIVLIASGRGIGLNKYNGPTYIITCKHTICGGKQH